MRSRPLSVLVRTALDEFQQRIRAALGESVLDVRLFGSYARGTANDHSDIDVLVVLESAGWTQRRCVLDHAADTSVASGVVLSPTILDGETLARWRRQERPLIMEIEREGVRL